MLSLYSGFINNLEAKNNLTCCITVVCNVEKFYYFSCMDYIPTFEKGKRFNDDYYDFIKALGIELEKEGYIKHYIQDKWMYIFSGLETFEGEETFEWLKAKNHCIYLIDSLSLPYLFTLLTLFIDILYLPPARRDLQLAAPKKKRIF